ncbi:MAG: hypothetical protein HQL72_04220 [Magnetococcales bacterium]|nr:hypothetical protein [Magnetococcales bacterium]
MEKKTTQSQESEFQPAMLAYSAPMMGIKLQRIHRAQSVLDLVRDGLGRSSDPNRDQWVDSLLIVGEELDRLFDDITVGRRV